MSGSRLVRGTRSRLFLYIGVVVVGGLAVYLFHGAQLQLDDARKAADKCQQQQESLSAQLQVIFEYKLRLEKSLQQEKAEHRHTREELEARAATEKQFREKENLEAVKKYAALQQQYKLLTSEHKDLNEECSKMRVEKLQGLEERGKLQAELEQLQASHNKALNHLKNEHMRLEVENKQLQEQHENYVKGNSQTSNKINHLEKQNLQLQRELHRVLKELEVYKTERSKHHNEEETVKVEKKIAPPSPSPPSSVSSAAPDAGQNVENQNVLQEPLANPDNVIDKASSRSTTPQINPQAVLSQDRGQQQSNNVAPVPPPRQDKQEEVKEPVVPNIPRPAVVEPVNNLPAGVVPAPQGGPWAWPRFRHGPQPVNPQPRDDNGPEEEEDEEDPVQPHHGGQEIPRQLPNSYQYGADLQVEEGEEEEDDDVDQVDQGDYANEVAAGKLNKQHVVKKQHDSVMVNPK